MGLAVAAMVVIPTLGPKSASATVSSSPDAGDAFDHALVVNRRGTQIPARNTKYQLFSEGKVFAEGITNEKGETALAQSRVPQDAVLKHLDH